MMVGRDVELQVVEGSGGPGRRGAQGRGPRWSETTEVTRWSTACRLDVHAGEIVVRRRRPGQRPDRARRGDHGPAAARRRVDPDPRPRRHPRLTRRTCCGPASGMSPRTASRTGSSSTSPSPTTSCSTRSTRLRSRTGSFADQDAIRRAAEERAEAFDVRTSSVARPCVGALGGQPAEGDRGPRVLAADPAAGREPTDPRPRRRFDRVHPRTDRGRSATRGRRSCWSRSELDEVFALADRIAVMYQGRIVDVLPGDRADREQVGLLMAGAEWRAPPVR